MFVSRTSQVSDHGPATGAGPGVDADVVEEPGFDTAASQQEVDTDDAGGDGRVSEVSNHCHTDRLVKSTRRSRKREQNVDKSIKRGILVPVDTSTDTGHCSDTKKEELMHPDDIESGGGGGQGVGEENSQPIPLETFIFCPPRGEHFSRGRKREEKSNRENNKFKANLKTKLKNKTKPIKSSTKPGTLTQWVLRNKREKGAKMLVGEQFNCEGRSSEEPPWE